MRGRITHIFSAKVLVTFVATILLALGICFIGVGRMVALAADTTVASNTEGYYVKNFTAAEFNTYKETETYPKLTSEDGNDSQDWLFAGWYQDDACETAYGTDTTSIADTSTTVYAKFVLAEVMTVKCQVTPGTDEDSEKTNMRLISTTDSAEYIGVGFDVVYKGKTTPCSTSTLYKRVSATDDGMESGYSPVAFSQDSEYFFSVRLINISNANFDEEFYIQPYWVTPDGTKVVGVCRYARIEDSYKEIVNLPVRLYSDAEVTSGNASLAYDTTKFEFYGFNAGTVFSTVNVSDDTTNGTLTISGSADAAVVADGVFANIRLQLKEGQLIESNTTFKVTNNGFTNTSNSVTINVSDVTYKNYAMTYAGTPDKSWYEEFKNTEDTFVLSTAADLYGFAELVNASADGLKGKTFKLGADVTINKGTASESDFTMSDSTAIRYAWTPIGDADSAFDGTFDGQNNVIQGIFIDSSANYLGLFGKAGESGVIQNFELRNSYINSTHNYPLVGSVAGYCNGQVNNVYSNAFINCTGNYSGGLIGRSEKGVDILGCWFDGVITTAGTNCGGILGALEASASATSSGSTTIKSCLNSGKITSTATGNTFIGGLVGVVKQFDSFEMEDCLSAGSMKVNTTTTVGSVVGQVNNKISAGAKFMNVFTTDAITDTSGAALSAFANQGGEGYSLGSHSVYAIDSSYVPKVKTTAAITGFASYDVALDYTDSDANEVYWVARVDGTPVIERFAKNNVIPYPETAWYSANETSKNYTIQNVSELYGFAKLAQTADFAGWTINLVEDKEYEINDGKASKWSEEAPKYEWVASGISATSAFAGTFNGNGATISGIYVNTSTNCYGLFGRAKAGSIIQDFALKNSYFQSSGEYPQMGSIVGLSQGTILENVYSDAIINCAGSYVGGLVGLAKTSALTVKNSWYAGELTNAGTSTGGIVGATQTTANIDNCLNTGSVHSTKAYAGGICGYAETNASKLVINNSMNAGAITTEFTYTGATGSVFGTVAANAAVSLSNTYVVPTTGINTYGDIGSGATKTIDAVTGLFTFAKADITGYGGHQLALDFTDIWVAKEDGTPELKAFATGSRIAATANVADISWYTADGGSSESTPYEIADAGDLYGVALLSKNTNYANKYIKIIDEVDTITVNAETVAEWEQIAPNYKWPSIGRTSGDTSFKGHFDGNDKTISGIYLNTTLNNVGLFGRVSDGSEIKNLAIKDSYFKTTADYSSLGSVAGLIEGSVTVENVYSNAKVVNAGTSNAQWCGGLVGRILNTGTVNIMKCWNAGTVSNTGTRTGGIVGYINGTPVLLDNCLNTGTVHGTGAFTGGLCGYTEGTTTLTITNSMNTGTITSDNTYAGATGSIFGTVAAGAVTLKNTYVVTQDGRQTYGDIGSSATKTIDAVTGLFTFAKDKITSYGGHQLALDFEDIWVAKEDGTPELKAFATDSTIAATDNVADISWHTADGGASESAPYEIADAGDLYGLTLLSRKTTFSGKYFKLMGNITVNSEDASAWTASSAPNYKWEPIGYVGASGSTAFAGKLDGNNKTISGLYANTGSNMVGLIGRATAGSEIKNLTLTNSVFFTTVAYAQMGSVVGLYEGAGNIENVTSDARVVNSSASNVLGVGGIVGRIINAEVKMTQCKYAGTLTNAGENTGGMVGQVHTNGTATLATCASTNAVTGGRYAAGIIGLIGPDGNASLTNCLNAGTVTSTYTGGYAQTGGLCGATNGNAPTLTITNSFNSGNVSTSVGGTGSILGHAITGTVTITNTYATNESYMSNNVADVVGYKQVTVDESKIYTFAKADISGYGGYQMTLDFTDTWVAKANETPELKAFATGETLTANSSLVADTSWYTTDGGSSEASPYLIADAGDLYGMSLLSRSTNFAGKYFKVTADITVNTTSVSTWETTAPSYAWTPIGRNNSFAGTFDGNNKTISGLYHSSNLNYVGLFGQTATGSTLKNVILKNSYFASTSAYPQAGSIVGNGNGTFHTIYSEAIVKCTGLYQGGIVARTETGLTMTNCWFAGEMSVGAAKAGAGGILGYIAGGTAVIENCLTTGDIVIDYDVATDGYYPHTGALCGQVAGGATLNMNRCLAAGEVAGDGLLVSVGAVVGRISANANATIDNTYATTQCHSKKIGDIDASAGTVTTNITEAVEADQLIGYSDYLSDNTKGLDFGTYWTLRNNNVPGLISFVATSDRFTYSDSALALSSFSDSSITLANAEDGGPGDYVFRVSDATGAKYETYLSALSSAGFTKKISNDSGLGSVGVKSATYTKGNWVVNVSYAAYDYTLNNVGVARKHTIVSVSTGQVMSPHLTAEQSYSKSDAYTETAGDGFTRLHMVETYASGSSFIFKLPNGHFIINDGGTSYELRYLIDYLYSLTNGQKPIVEAWTITHTHFDHSGVLRSFLDYPDLANKLYVEGIYINLPSENARSVEEAINTCVAYERSAIKLLKTTGDVKTPVYRYYTGQRYYFDGLTMDVVQTHEQFPQEWYTVMGTNADYNVTSTGLMFTTDNGYKTYLSGDQNKINMAYIMNSYNQDYWEEVNVFSACHHGDSTWDEFTTWMCANRSQKLNVLLYPARTLLTDSANTTLQGYANATCVAGDGSYVLTFTDSTIGVNQKAMNTWKYNMGEERPE